MSVVVAGQSLGFDEEQRSRLGRAVEELLQPAYSAHAETARLCKLDWDWYDATPYAPERSRPFKGASNVVYPLIATHADSIQARRFLALFANTEIWAAKTNNEKWRIPSEEYVRFLNHEADDNAFDLSTPMNDSLLGATVTGSGPIAIQYGQRVRHRFLPGSNVPRTVRMHRGIHVLAVPREQIFWQPDRTLRDSEYVVRSTRMSLADLVRAASPVTQGGGGWNREEVARLIEGRPSTENSSIGYTAPDDLLGLRDTPFASTVVHECWIEWPLLRGMRVPGPGEDDFAARPAIVAYYHRETQRVLHVMAHPYPIQGWPFYDFGYGLNRPTRRGVAKALQHLQASISSSFNQGHDAVTWSNRVLGLTRDKGLMGRIFGDGLVYTDMEISDTNFQVKPQPFIQPNEALIQIALAAAERLTGMSDPNFGRESRSGGHPAPATSTIALLKQGQTVLARTLAFDRQELARIGEDMISFYQAFEAQDNADESGNGYIERVMGAGDAREIRKLMFPAEPLAGLLEMDVRAVSEAQNAAAAFQQAVQVDQVLTNYYGAMLQTINIAIQATAAPPQFATPIMQVAFQAMVGKTESTRRILTAANVDDIETFTEILQNAITGPTLDALKQVQLAASAGLQAAGGAPQSSPVATGPDGFPAGAASPAA